MDKKMSELIDVHLAHAGEATMLSPKTLLLEQLRITPEKQLKPMEFLFRLFGKLCFPKGELVAITGKAKSGKTFVTSMLMAKGLGPGPSPQGEGRGRLQGDRLSCLQRNGDKPLKVMWYDTEQSDESTQDILKNRILKSLGGVASLDVFNVRVVEWKQRRELLKEAVERCQPDLVIVDGIRDLVNDINDGVLAQEVMEELMHLATALNCCIVCVLHQNKSGEDRNLRGWIGTELMNKAFEVYACEKMMPQRIFKLEQTLTRKYDIEQTLYFEVGDDGLPREASPAAAEEGVKTSAEPLPQLNPEYIIHDDTLKGGWQFDVPRLFLNAMGDNDEVSGKELRERVMKLSGIVMPFKYNKLLDDALAEKVIEKSMSEGRVIYRPAPF